MFDKYIICEDSLRPRDDGAPGGQLQVRMPYYRGLALSMVEEVDVTIDGALVPRHRTTFAVHGNRYTFDEMPHVIDDRWEMGERADLAFDADQPLRAGMHDVEVVVRLRISYMPVPGGGRDFKQLAFDRGDD